MIGALAAGAFLLGLSLWMARRARRNALSRLRAAWGRPIDRERDMDAIADGPARLRGLDDRTWNDLLLDDVFAAIDRTASSIGQQALYSRLRTVPLPPHRDEFEALAVRFERDPAARARAQLSLAALSDPAAYTMRRLCGPGALDRRTWHAIFPVVAAAMIGAILLAFARPAYLLIVIVGVGVNLVLRASTAPQVGAEIAAFRQIGPLLAAGAPGPRSVGRVHPRGRSPVRHEATEIAASIVPAVSTRLAVRSALVRDPLVHRHHRRSARGQELLPRRSRDSALDGRRERAHHAAPVPFRRAVPWHQCRRADCRR